MNITVVQERTTELIDMLVLIWVTSVKGSHLFLSPAALEEIATCIPTALQEIPHLILATNDEGAPIGFMGVDGDNLEMLFLAPEAWGMGTGRRLVDYAVANYGIHRVSVNEQNPKAFGFYKHMGFKVIARTQTDNQGRPYPILLMSLK